MYSLGLFVSSPNIVQYCYKYLDINYSSKELMKNKRGYLSEEHIEKLRGLCVKISAN